jgi:hypothetical protein
MTGQKNSAPQGAQEKLLINGGKVNTDNEYLVRFLDAVKNPSDRVWYVTDEGDLRPSNKGVMFKPTLAPELLRGIALAAQSFDPKEAA